MLSNMNDELAQIVAQYHNNYAVRIPCLVNQLLTKRKQTLGQNFVKTLNYRPIHGCDRWQ